MLKKYLHISLWIIVFFKGVIRFLDFYPAPIFRAVVPFIVLIIFIISLERNDIIFPFIGLFLFLTLVCLLSFKINSVSLQSAIYFFNYLLIPYLYFIVIVNENNQEILKLVKKLIIILFLIQIPANWIKYFLVGQREEFIGTIGYTSGSLSTIVPMFVISFFIFRLY